VPPAWLGYFDDTGLDLGCVPVGTKRVKQNGGNNHTKNGVGQQYDGGFTNAIEAWPGYADADGTETVEAWDCHPDCAVALLDEQSGERRGFQSQNDLTARDKFDGVPYGTGMMMPVGERQGFNDTGGASRFFLNVAPDAETVRMRYEPKASRRERNAGLDGMPERVGDYSIRNGICANCGKVWIDGKRIGPCCDQPERTSAATIKAANSHPCVKPIALMSWLIRLVCKPGQTVLDPFMGSGSTGCAAALEGVTFIGIEQNAEYIEIAERRIAHWTEHGADGLKPKATVRKTIETHTDLPLFAPLSLVAD
jgi:hypothetical protein